MSRSARATRVIVALVLAGTVAACSTKNLNFVQDNRLSITSPTNGETVRLPIDLQWRVAHYDGAYAVFFDSAIPMRPGGNLLSLVPGSDPCRLHGTCPDAAWLNDRLIFVTRSTSLHVETLPDRSGRRSEKDPHEVTIVLLDENGQRRGESAFVREFVIDRSEP